MKPLNETCRLLLNKIGRTRNADIVTLIGILADAMEEANHPYANKLRKLYQHHMRREEYAALCDFSRSPYWTRGEWIGSWRRVLRRRVGNMFGRRWANWQSNLDYA